MESNALAFSFPDSTGKLSVMHFQKFLSKYTESFTMVI